MNVVGALPYCWDCGAGWVCADVAVAVAETTIVCVDVFFSEDVGPGAYGAGAGAGVEVSAAVLVCAGADV